MRLITFIILLVAAQSICQAQLADLIRLEYSKVPADDSGFEYNRQRFLFNYPVKLKEGTYIFMGVDYSSIELDFEQQITAFDQQKTDRFRLLDVNFTFTYPIDEDWRFAARLVPGFSSNLDSRSLLFEDMVISSAIVWIKDKKEAPDVPKPFRIIFGLAYSGNSGIPFPIPFVSYYKKFHPKWSYNVGVPTVNLQYHASERWRFKLYGRVDGFNSNLQNGLLVNDETLAQRINMNLFLGGLRYEYNIGQNLELFVTTLYIFRNRIQLRRVRNNILELDGSERFHYKTGIRLKV